MVRCVPRDLHEEVASAQPSAARAAGIRLQPPAREGPHALASATATPRRYGNTTAFTEADAAPCVSRTMYTPGESGRVRPNVI
jgi:hypothetical protein